MLNIRERAKQAVASMERSRWELSEIVYEIWQFELYRDWGFESFREYVEGDLDIDLRQGQNFVYVWKWYYEMPKKIQKWARSLGFSRIIRAARIVDANNFSEWKDVIEYFSNSKLEIIIAECRKSGLSCVDILSEDFEQLRGESLKSFMSRLRTKSFSNKDIAFLSGLDESHVKSSLRDLPRITIPKDVYDFFEKNARERGESMADYIRLWLIEIYEESVDSRKHLEVVV